MNFKDILKDLRLENNLTHKELAQKIGYSKAIIGFWESGKYEPTGKALIELTKFFNISMEKLLGIEEKIVINKKNKDDKKELKILDIYNNLSEVNQNRWLAYGEGMLLGENKAILNENLKIEITNKRKN